MDYVLHLRRTVPSQRRPPMPKRPMTEAQMIAHNERALAARRAEAQATRRRQDLGPEDRDEYWSLRRSWTGEEYFVPGTERNVTHQYNPLDALDD
jgi:hypothetical protein